VQPFIRVIEVHRDGSLVSLGGGDTIWTWSQKLGSPEDDAQATPWLWQVAMTRSPNTGFGAAGAEVLADDVRPLSARRSWKLVAYPLLLCTVVVVLGTRGIGSEWTVSLQGDMPRYLMNGVYFYDLIRDLPLTDPIGYTERYFARYPALSLGHHPLLVGWAEVPFFAVFGVSVFAGRVMIVVFTIVGLLAWFQTVRQIYDPEVALFAALLLATTPYVVGFSRVVLSEIPTLALVLVTIYFFHRYCENLRRRDAYLFAIAAALSCYAKQLAALILPICFIYFVLQHGVRPLFRRDCLLAGCLFAVLIVPLVPITLTLSKANVAWVSRAPVSYRVSATNLGYYWETLWRHHVTTPLLALSAISLVGALLRRDRRVLFFALWVVGFYLEVTYGGARDPRFLIYWIPAFCLFAASALALVHSPPAKAVAAAVLTAVVVDQFATAYRAQPAYASGYEAAAQYVLEHRRGESVLYSARIDSGYFVFFVRKHNPERNLVVVRADKTLVTSALTRITTENLTSREEIYDLLRDLGVGFVVIEDSFYESTTLELLRQELTSDNFELHTRIPIRSSSTDLDGVDLAIYEFKGYTPARLDKPLQMRIPLIGSEVVVRFGDLLPTPQNQ